MKAEVVFLPSMLRPDDLQSKTAIVFDVLRATTTMTAALSMGIDSIRIYPTLEAVRRAGDGFKGNKLLCGEQACVKPKGFDLGNSPGQFDRASHADATLLMATTNGTKAILAAQTAANLFVAALVNATAAAEVAARCHRPVVLLCAGTQGEVSTEDILGSGAVLTALKNHGYEETGDAAQIALHLFDAARNKLPEVLRETTGGRNIRRVQLDDDIIFAARLDVFDEVGQVEWAGKVPVIRSAGR